MHFSTVGAGYSVYVDGVFRGQTDQNGQLTMQVMNTSSEVEVALPPSDYGEASIGTITPGQTNILNVGVREGKDAPTGDILSIDQVMGSVLPSNASRVSLRFTHQQQFVPMGLLDSVLLSGPNGSNTVDLSNACSIANDGSITCLSAALFAAVAGSSGQQSIDIEGNDASGNFESGTVAFYVGTNVISGQVLPPTLTPNLPVSGLTVTATLTGTNLTFNANTDAKGNFAFPLVPSGNLVLSVTTTNNGTTYSSQSSSTLTQSTSFQLPLVPQ